MKDEIKEIKINKANGSITFINNGIVFSQFGIAKEILDLITNLQEENEDYKSRIEKATEYIKNDWYELNTRDIEHCINLNKDIRIDLLNILQGVGKDER